MPRRLNETITSLLELAMLDMNYTQPSLKPIAIDELIWGAFLDYWIQKIGKGSFLRLHVMHLPDDPEKLQVLANKSLLTIAFNNIISNAFKIFG